MIKMEYAKDKKIRKMIRISEEENDNWDIVKVHEFLQNKLPGDNNHLQKLYEIMTTKMIPKTKLSPEEMTILLEIEEMI